MIKGKHSRFAGNNALYAQIKHWRIGQMTFAPEKLIPAL